jgi:hypothetical protein
MHRFLRGIGSERAAGVGRPGAGGEDQWHLRQDASTVRARATRAAALDRRHQDPHRADHHRRDRRRHDPLRIRRAPRLLGRPLPRQPRVLGKRRSGRTRHASKWLDEALKDAAMAAIRTNDGYLQAQYQRRRPRIGHGPALGAVKHSILCACWHVLSHRRALPRPLRAPRPERQTRRLIAHLERLGPTVTLQKAALSPTGFPSDGS